jgi:hypothetical protein
MQIKAAQFDLVVEPTPLKNDGVPQIGSSSQLLGKIKIMFQTTNQIPVFRTTIRGMVSEYE